MSSGRLLARLTARGVQIGGVGGRSTTMTKEDIAAALGYALSSPVEGDWLLMAYCGEALVAERFFQGMMPRVRKLCAKYKVDSDWSHHLLNLAVTELLDAEVCRTCRGDEGRECQVCNGLGLKPKSVRVRAQILGVGKDAFQRKYERLANEVYRELSHIDQCALRAVARQFAEDEAA